MPSTGQHCRLADLPAGRRQPSMENNVVCGGKDGPEHKTSCLTLTSGGTWEKTTELLDKRQSFSLFSLVQCFSKILNLRVGHCSWASPSGLILLGGYDSRRTTEMIQENGTSAYSFTLEYDLKHVNILEGFVCSVDPRSLSVTYILQCGLCYQPG